VRKLIGSNKKGKRVPDKSVREVRPVEDTVPEEYSLDDILMGDYLIDDTISEDHIVDDPVMEDYLTTDVDADMKEYLIDDPVMEEYLIGDPVESEHHAGYDAAGYKAAGYDAAEEQLEDDEQTTEEQSADKKGRRKRNIKIRRIKRPWGRRHIIFAAMIAVGIFFVVAALRVILSDVIEDAVARNEYDQLREEFPQVSGHGSEQTPDNTDPGENADESEAAAENMALREYSLDELAAINRDFVGWINANNNAIDYPVVRGSDNEKYINTTFFGTRNSAGAIFMDYRHTLDFDESIVLLYGHRTRDGSMFSTLISHLDPEYRRRNPNINILTRDGTKLTYVIFAAKLTNAWDPAYAVGAYDFAGALELFPNAPANARRFLLLSTCTSSSDDDERVLVFAASLY